jgi:hypothetical protein
MNEQTVQQILELTKAGTRQVVINDLFFLAIIILVCLIGGCFLIIKFKEERMPFIILFGTLILIFLILILQDIFFPIAAMIRIIKY